MISKDLNDEESCKEIREFVRNHEHILFTDYVDRGYNGIVYFGKRIKMKEDVVVKFYLANKDYDSSEEAVILRKIDNYNILHVDLLRYLPPWNSYFLSPKISGGDLQGLIDSNESISTLRALRFIQGILSGVNELHNKHNLVHRDLKPGNILYRLEDDSPVIADLGSVKKIDSASGYVGASKCTTLFLPPESIFENKYYYQSDIYQIGITLFQLLGGKFPLNSPLEFLNIRDKAALRKIDKSSLEWEKLRSKLTNKKIADGKLIKLKTLPNYLDLRFRKVIGRATKPDFQYRYNNVSEFLTDVNKLIRHYPNYHMVDDTLFISHKDSSKFKVYQNSSEDFTLEKFTKNGKWRKVKKHNGQFSEVLKLANKV